MFEKVAERLLSSRSCLILSCICWCTPESIVRIISFSTVQNYFTFIMTRALMMLTAAHTMWRSSLAGTYGRTVKQERTTRRIMMRRWTADQSTQHRTTTYSCWLKDEKILWPRSSWILQLTEWRILWELKQWCWCHEKCRPEQLQRSPALVWVWCWEYQYQRWGCRGAWREHWGWSRTRVWTTPTMASLNLASEGSFWSVTEPGKS